MQRTLETQEERGRSLQISQNNNKRGEGEGVFFRSILIKEALSCQRTDSHTQKERKRGGTYHCFCLGESDKKKPDNQPRPIAQARGAEGGESKPTFKETLKGGRLGRKKLQRKHPSLVIHSAKR